MATITIIELNSVGGQGAIDGSPVINLSSVIKTTVDATTSTSVENITLDPDTRFVVCLGDAAHRVSVKDSTVADRYTTLDSSRPVEAAVNKSDRTLYYRSEA